MINSTIGSYRIIRPLGAGGMAQIFEARNTISGQHVALKFLANHATDPADLRRFRREAEIVQQLSHPNIITIYEIGDVQGRPYIALELLSNSLEALLQSGPLQPDKAMQLLIPLLDGLDYAHQHGLVHRDIKPANVLLRSDGTPVLADFDLARPQTVDPRTRITVEGELLGTPAYMAPEQLRGAQLDGRTDLYACGAMLFEMLTGRTPFEGDLSQTITGHLQQTPPELRTLAPNTPPALAELVERMLAKDPARRPYSAVVVRAALEAILSGAALPPHGIAATPSGAAIPAVPSVQSARPAMPGHQKPPLHSSMKTAAMIVGIINGLMLVAAVIAVIAQTPPFQSRQLEPGLVAQVDPTSAPTLEVSLPITSTVGIESTEVATLVSTETPLLEPSPTAIPTRTPRPTIVPEIDTLSEVGAPLLTDPQTVTGEDGATYVVGSVGISEVAKTGVFILYAEVLANQASNQRASVDVVLRDATGNKLATGTGLTQSPFIDPYQAGALLVVLIPDQPITPETAISGEFSIKLLPAEQPALALDVEPGVQVSVLGGSVPTYQLSGTITNNQQVALKNCKAIALLYDQQFRVIAIEGLALQTSDETLAPGESLTFDKGVFSLGTPASGYRVYAYGEAAE